jgi:hypothetical protein
MGLGKALEQFVLENAVGFFWPKSMPLAAPRSTTQAGIIVGNLLDPNTPYKWAQAQSAAFPQMRLVTTELITHVLGPDDVTEIGENKATTDPQKGGCFGHITAYLATGVLPEDGTTCGSIAGGHPLFEALAAKIKADTVERERARQLTQAKVGL